VITVAEKNLAAALSRILRRRRKKPTDIMSRMLSTPRTALKKAYRFLSVRSRRGAGAAGALPGGDGNGAEKQQGPPDTKATDKPNRSVTAPKKKGLATRAAACRASGFHGGAPILGATPSETVARKGQAMPTPSPVRTAFNVKSR
jgi:hypothetical protein